MKWPKGDPKYTKIAVYVIITGAALMIIFKLIGASENLWASVTSALKFLYKAVKPVIAGLVIAYILLPASNLFEKGLKKIFKKQKRAKLVRMLSLLGVFLIVVGVMMSFIFAVVPAIAENMGELIKNLPDYYDSVYDWYINEVEPSELIRNTYSQNAIQDGLAFFEDGLGDILTSIVSKVAVFTFSVVSAVAIGILAVIISFYVIAGRKKIANEVEITANVYLGEERTLKIKAFLKSVDKVFGKYISAKLVQIFLIFILCQVSFLIIGAPYSTFLALIIAVTNAVPFIGPIVGIVPVVLITLLESPITALWVLGAILVIQILDAYIFQPFFIGDKMGLSPFWVLVSVIVGGGLFGVWGILLSVPIAAVIKVLIRNYIISGKSRLSEKKVEKQKEEKSQEDTV